jgi:Mo-co oxidoreductase dimerisation domain
MKLKSEIARPGMYEVLEPNRICTISGAAWAGQTVVTEIAVSTDGGQTWAEAEFVDSVQRHAWRRWKFDWMVPNAPDDTPCWRVPGTPTAPYSLISMTSATAAM